MDMTKVTRPARKLLKLKRCGAVIVAAGSASRMGGIDKVMAPLGGEPMIVKTVRAFQDCDAIRDIVVVTREDLIRPITSLLSGMDKVIAVVAGGASRQESVHLGLNTLPEKTELAAIHDGARPFVSPELLDRVLRAAAETGAAAPAVPVKDTIKRAEQGVVLETLDRSTLYAVQTPQVFQADFISAALYTCIQEGVELTDDCSAAERMGKQVALVEGAYENIKITTPVDLAIGEALLQW